MGVNLAGSAKAPFGRSSIAVHGVYGSLVVLCLLAAVSSPAFLTAGNLLSIVRQSAALSLVALGQTFLIIMGGMDLSVGMVIGLVATLACGLMDGQDALALFATLIGLGIGIAVGVINGLLICRLRVQPVVITFGMYSVVQGIIFLYTDRSIGQAADSFRWLTEGMIGWLPVPLLLIVTAGAAAHLALKKTVYGRYLYAIGGHEENARRAGIPVARVKWLAYALCGLSAGASGLLVASRVGTGYPYAGFGYELDSIVATVVGGTSLAGGRGGAAGTVAAVFLLTVLGNYLNLVGIPSFTQQVLKGLVVVGAVALYSWGRR